MSGDPLSDVREPIEQLSLQAKGFLDSLNAVLELGQAPDGLSGEERELLSGNLPPLRTTIEMVYRSVMGEAIPDAFPENPVTGLMLEPGGRVLTLHFEEENGGKVFREVIGGNLEMVYLPHDRKLACFVDEDGIAKSLPENARAALLFEGLPSAPKIFGPMIVCGWDPKEDLLLDCPEPIFELLQGGSDE